MSLPSVDELLERNKVHQSSHTPLPKLSEVPEIPKTIIVSCADPRIHPESIFQLQPTDVIIIRNVGGHTQTALQDIIALDTNFGLTNLIVVHHEDCGTTYWTNEQTRSKLKEQHPEITTIDEIDFGAVGTSLEQSIVDDLNVLTSAPLLRKELGETARGFLYSIKTGELKEIKA